MTVTILIDVATIMDGRRILDVVYVGVYRRIMVPRGRTSRIVEGAVGGHILVDGRICCIQLPVHIHTRELALPRWSAFQRAFLVCSLEDVVYG